MTTQASGTREELAAAFARIDALTDTIPDQAPATPLWAVHVAGPDDMLAMADRAAADRTADQINAVAQTLRDHSSWSPLDPPLSATVVEWPHDDAAGHAKALASWIADGEVYQP